MDEELYEFTITPIKEIFYNEDSSWGVFEFETYNEVPHTKMQYDIFTDKIYYVGSIVGKMQRMNIGTSYDVKATSKYNAKYKSYQFIPESIVSLKPKSSEEQLMFLKTITSANNAQVLINEYPNLVQDVINEEIDELEYDKLKGINQKSWYRIRDCVKENFALSDIIVLLQPLGITYNVIKNLLRNYKDASLLKTELNNNPYIITNVRGIGFKKADKIALGLKPNLVNSMFRLNAYIKYYLHEVGENNGHTYVLKQDLLQNISNNVPECLDLIQDVFEHNQYLHIEDNRIGLNRYYNTEMDCYNFLLERKKYVNSKYIFEEDYVDKTINEVEKKQGFKYIEDQLKEIRSIINDEVVLLSGSAGTGKSSIMRAILAIYKDKGFKVACCSLSAKAAKRITEATGCNATTIHRLLGWQGNNGFVYNEDNKLDIDLLFLDEASMVNAELFRNLLLATDQATRLIICGDHKQLPPIGYGNIFSDLLLDKQNFSTHILTKIMRQAEKSGIISDGNIIREGINPINKPDLKTVHGELHDMYYMFRENREQLNQIAIKTYLSSVEKEGVDNVQIIVPRKKDCINSAKEINMKIQGLLLEDVEEIKYGDNVFKLGAKVKQTVNNSEKNVYNGEIGYIKKIYEEKDNEGHNIKCCDIHYVDLISNELKCIKYKQSDLKEIDLAYAMTCHSCQGSGYNTMIGIIDNTHYTLLDNCMLYTLVTRAKKRCLLLSEPKAFLKCINTSHNERNTWLKETIITTSTLQL